MKKTILVIIILLSISCKNENKQSSEKQSLGEQKTIQVEKDDIFKIAINFKVLEDDEFELFYVIDSPEGKFNSKDRLSKNIKGSNDFQNIEFKLPKNNLPYKLRIDLGGNGIRNESNVEINNIMLKLNETTIDIDSSQINIFFQHNIYLQKINNVYSRRIYKGKYDPFIYSKPILGKKIELEL